MSVEPLLISGSRPIPADRFARQADLVPRERLAALTVSVLGVGAIGRAAALQLAALGVPRLQLVDFDTVEPTNITTQGYRRPDLGVSKVRATARAIQELDPEITVLETVDRCRPEQTLGEGLFCCVDSIAARAAIWRTHGRGARFWCDGRMLGETVRVLTVAGECDRTAYAATLFRPEDAHTGRCTSRSTLYAATLAAALMVHQFTRWLRQLPTDTDLVCNLLASELTVSPGR